MVNDGQDASRINEVLLRDKLEASIYITVDTLKYLKKGGRITAAAAAFGTVLGIKPVLQIQGEKLDAFAMAHGMKSAKKADARRCGERPGDPICREEGRICRRSLHLLGRRGQTLGRGDSRTLRRQVQRLYRPAVALRGLPHRPRRLRPSAASRLRSGEPRRNCSGEEKRINSYAFKKFPVPSGTGNFYSSSHSSKSYSIKKSKASLNVSVCGIPRFHSKYTVYSSGG